MNSYIAALRKYGDWRTRASRSEYWLFVLFDCIVSYVLVFLDQQLGLLLASEDLGYLLNRTHPGLRSIILIFGGGSGAPLIGVLSSLYMVAT